jgi:hypothetical protein
VSTDSARETAAPLVHDRTHLDWLTVTHDKGEPLRAILRGPTEKLKSARGVYPHAERDGHCAVHASGGPEPRPFMLQLSGRPLAEWRADPAGVGPERASVHYLTEPNSGRVTLCFVASPRNASSRA